MPEWMVGEWCGDGSELASALLNLHQDRWPLGKHWCCGPLATGAILVLWTAGHWATLAVDRWPLGLYRCC